MAVVAIALAFSTSAFAAMQLAAVFASEGGLLAGSVAPGLGSAAASRPVGAEVPFGKSTMGGLCWFRGVVSYSAFYNNALGEMRALCFMAVLAPESLSGSAPSPYASSIALYDNFSASTACLVSS